MAVISIEEEFDKRRGTISTQERVYTRSFQVRTDSKWDSQAVVLAYVQSQGLIVGTSFPDDAGAWCRDITAEPKAGATAWVVTANYSSAGSEIAQNPLQDAAKITWTTEQFQIPAIVDEDDKAIVNSAGDPFDPPNMRDFSRRIAVVTKNMSSPPSWLLDYQDAVNSATFQIDGISIPADKAKCQRVDISDIRERSGIQYREVTTEIHFSRDGWKLRPLDQGFRTYGDIITGDLYERLNIVNDGDNERPTQPVLLDGEGGLLQHPSIDTAVFLEFSVYPRKPFNVLPLT